MKIQYPYRFKTEEEFKKEFGNNWMRSINLNGKPNWAFDGEMDHLFGKVFPYTKDQLNMSDKIYPIGNGIRWNDPESQYDWSISWDMLTKNIILPDYTPKKRIERTL